MSSRSLVISWLRGLTLVVVGSFLGAALVGPVSAGGPSPSVTTHTRVASCAGLDFYPLESATTYAANGTMRTANDYVLCDPGLPHRAVVKKVQFSLYDNGPGSISDCALVRTGLKSFNFTSAQVMASVPDTSSGVLGFVRFADSSISFPTIDNAQFGYFLQCNISTVDANVGLFGASVTYTISTTNG